MNKIRHEYRDGDGYWIDLEDGWQNGNDPGAHSIVEDNKRKAYQTLKNAKPCYCPSCLRAKRKEEKELRP